MKVWQFILVSVAAFTLYANTLNHGFVLDDFSAITKNRIVQKGTDGIPEIFTTHYRKGYWENYGNLYRPLALSSMALDYELVGQKASFYHVVNVMYYVLIALLLLTLMSRWFGETHTYLPLIITLLYLFHPIHTEVVANIKSRDELMSFAFLLAAFLFLWDYVAKSKPLYLVGTLLAFMLALLSKESSIAFLVLLPLSAYVLQHTSLKKSLQIAGVLLIPVLVFIALRSMTLDGQAEAGKSLTESLSLTSSDPVESLLRAGYFLMMYLWKLLVPYPLAAQYVEWAGGISGTMKAIGAVGLLGHAALVWFGFKWVKQRNPLGLVVLFYLIAHFLHSNVILTIGTSFGERLLFTPSLAFSMLTGMLLVKYLGPQTKPMWAALAVVLLAYAALTVERNKAWESNMTLYAADVETQPESSLLNYWYALELTNTEYLASLSEAEEKQSLEKGMKHFEKALSLDHDFGNAEAQIGLTYYKLGVMDKALIHYNKALDNGRGSIETLNNVAAIHFGNGDFEKAKYYYETAVEKNPNYTDAWGNLGITYAQLAEFESAERAFEKAIELSPKNAQFQLYMGMTLNELKREEEAALFFEKAFELNPALRQSN